MQVTINDNHMDGGVSSRDKSHKLMNILKQVTPERAEQNFEKIIDWLDYFDSYMKRLASVTLMLHARLKINLNLHATLRDATPMDLVLIWNDETKEWSVKKLGFVDVEI